MLGNLIFWSLIITEIFGNYFEYTAYMWSQRDNPNLLVLFYEDIKKVSNPYAKVVLMFKENQELIGAVTSRCWLLHVTVRELVGLRRGRALQTSLYGDSLRSLMGYVTADARHTFQVFSAFLKGGNSVFIEAIASGVFSKSEYHSLA